MKLCKYSIDGVDGIIKFHTYDLFDYRLTIAISDGDWYEEDRPRLMPYWIDKDGLFAGRLAMKISKRT